MHKLSAEETEDRIKQILISELDVSPETVAALESTTPLLGRGIGLDSMESLALIAEIESKFNIQVADEELTVELFKSVAALAAFVAQKVVEERDCSVGGNDA